MFFVWYACCGAAGAVVFRAVFHAMRDGGHLRRNFQGRDIPTSLGAGFGLLAMLEAPAAELVLKPAAGRVIFLLALCCAFCALGLVDDLVRGRESGGFAGHFRRLGRGGKFSTALMKALFGLAACLGAVLAAGGGREWRTVAVNTLILALCANAVNLLDVKPGRAIKGFLFVLAAIIGGTYAIHFAGGNASIERDTLVLIVPFALWAISLWGYDLGCRGMMGDAGSNVLGAVLGVAVVWELSATARLIVLGLLVAFHLVCEVGSLSAIIQSVRPLRWLDNLGVKLLATADEKKSEKKSEKT